MTFFYENKYTCHILTCILNVQILNLQKLYNKNTLITLIIKHIILLEPITADKTTAQGVSKFIRAHSSNIIFL